MLFSKPNLNNCQSVLMSFNLVWDLAHGDGPAFKAGSGPPSQNKQERQTVFLTVTPDLADIVESYISSYSIKVML